MSDQNSIIVESNGQITFKDTNGSITINANGGQEVLKQLKLLNSPQIAILQQITEYHTQQLSEQFKKEIQVIAKEKNIVKGSITDVKGNVDIGDKIIYNYHYHAEKDKINKELTDSIPQTHPDDIIGREEDLEEVHELLSNNKRVVMVNGMGGIGKTTLAQVYVSKYYEEYQHIAWITQSSENVENDFINTAGLIENLQLKTTDLKPQEIFTEIVRKLKALEDKPNLLIIDNAEQSLHQYQHLLPSQPVWHLLLTSREDINGFYLKPLGFLNEVQALALFKKHYSHGKINEQEMMELIHQVDYHTLTIELLAKTAQVQRYDATTLKNAIKADLKANVIVPHNKLAGKIEKVSSYLQSIFNLSRLTEAEVWLLKQFACLPPTFHSYDLLYELIIDKSSPYKDSFSEILDGITQKGWLLLNKEVESYKMHPITTEMLKKEHSISFSDVKSLVNAVSEKLEIDRSKDNPVHRFTWIPFGRALLNSSNNLDEVSEIAKLQNNLALVLRALGDYKSAKALLEKAVRSAEKNFGTEHPKTAISYSNLAVMLLDLGDYKGAKTLLEKTLLSTEKNFGTEHPNTATSYSNLALALQDLRDYKGAKALLEKAVRSAEKNFGPEHPDTTISYSNLGLVLKDLGDYEGAKALLEKVVWSAEKNLEPEHPDIATSYSNLALVLQGLRDYKSAKTLLEKAVLSDEKNFGKEHPQTAQSYYNLAFVLLKLGNHEKALKLSEESKAILKKVLPEDHPLLKSVNNICEFIKSKYYDLRKNSFK